MDGSQAAFAFLEGLDEPISVLVREHGPVDFWLPSQRSATADPVSRLTLTIVGQLISAKVAIVLFDRLSALLGDSIHAEGLAQADPAALRAIGLSHAKARAVHELGVELVSGRFSFDELNAMSDDEAEARLVALRGVGPWSAQMFLLRSMRRPDVFPAGDLGLRRGIELIDGRVEMPSIPQAAKRALPWRPYRSYAAKYLWLHYGSAPPR